MAESFETALELSNGLAVIEFADSKKTDALIASSNSASGPNVSTHYAVNHILFSSKFACPISGFTIPEIEPRLFSFNNPFGACPTCGGIGHEQKIDPDLIVPNPKLTLRKGAIAPWSKSSSPYYVQTLEALGKHFKFRLETPYEELTKKIQNMLLYGSGEEEIKFNYDDGYRAYSVKKPFEGVVINLERRYLETDSCLLYTSDAADE